MDKPARSARPQLWGTKVNASNVAPDSELAFTLERYLTHPETRQDPYPTYAELRARAPVYRSRTGLWLVTGYDAVITLLRDPRLSRWQSARTEYQLRPTSDDELRRAIAAQTDSLINLDEPGHTRIRRLVREVFLPASIERLRGMIEETARTLVARVASRAEFDLLKEVAYPLPEIIICELLQVPHKDHALWSHWTEIITNINYAVGESEEGRIAAIERAFLEYYRYVKELVANRRANMGNDLVSALIRAGDTGDKLNEDELVGTIQLLIGAGHETTASFIANSTYCLLQDPTLYATLRKQPDRIPKVLDEFLRMVGTAHTTNPRMAIEDIEIAGVTIRKGERLLLYVSAANRDPAMFDDPERLDIDRPNMDRHVGFGAGAHFCLGRQLAQLEGGIMLREIVTGLPDLQLAEPVVWNSHVSTRSPQSLRVRRACRS